MNLTALQARCAFRYRDTGNHFVQADDWTEYLNDVYMDVVAADPLWPFLEAQTTSLSVAAGTGTVSLPTDVWRVTSVYNATDKIPLAPIPGRSEYRHWFPNPASSPGIPLWYRLRGSTLEVYPYASATTTLYADIASPPPLLATGSDEPVFPEQYHRILVAGALARAYEDDDRESGIQQARYERLLQDMKMDLLGPRTEGYPSIIDVGP